jgi:DNA-binding protein Fis
LGEDLVLLADKAHDGVARRASAQLGMAETTFRRQLQKVREDQQTGRLNRTPEWIRIGPILSQLLNSLNGASEENLSDRIREALLQEVICYLPEQDKSAAALMGVTLPTYRRWKAMARL